MVLAQQADTYYIKGKVAITTGNWSEAFKNFKEGAELGSSQCQYEVALCYERGEGIPVNFNLAFQYMHKAATGTKPWRYSYHSLGQYYRNGIGVAQNYEESYRWYYKGATTLSDDPIYGADCMFCLGVYYTYGLGIKQDYKQAVYWYKKAADFEHPVAAFNLGNRYINGEGVTKDEREAVKWWRKAAEMNNPNFTPCSDAQFNMGLVYLRGTGGVPISKTIALSWFKKAASNGNTSALIEIAKLEEEMK